MELTFLESMHYPCPRLLSREVTSFYYFRLIQLVEFQMYLPADMNIIGYPANQYTSESMSKDKEIGWV